MAKGSVLIAVFTTMLVITSLLLYMTKLKPAIISVILVGRYYFELDSDRFLRVTYGEIYPFEPGGFYRINGYKTKRLTQKEFENLLELAEVLEKKNNKIYFVSEHDYVVASVIYKTYTHEIIYSIYESPEGHRNEDSMFNSGDENVYKLINKFIEYSPMPITIIEKRQ